MGVGSGQDDVQIEPVSPQVVVARHHGVAWVHAAQAVSPKGVAGIHNATTRVLEQMRRLFDGVGVRFDQVVRTWLYVGGILELERGEQRYKEFNRARSDFYRDTSFLADCLPASAEGRRGPAYPASTGIGTADRGLVGSAIALDSGQREILRRALENPHQTAAYDYAAAYGLQSPKFSRDGPFLRRGTRRSSSPGRRASRRRRRGTPAIRSRRPTRPWTTSPP